jgi:hypothetical protein
MRRDGWLLPAPRPGVVAVARPVGRAGSVA